MQVEARMVAQLDAYRARLGQPTISALDGADKYSPSLHMPGDNASLLIYACALADFAAIDRDRFEVVAVTGNSMGWYLALLAQAWSILTLVRGWSTPWAA
jgi:[acyl-carrier-protein] S-malonyltransferase